MRILVTGFTGSLGTLVTKKLLEAGHTVIGVSRDELKQAETTRHDNLIKYLCDVRDRDRLVQASRGIDLVFHFAALKRVETLEENPEEAVQTNIFGTMNVLHAQRVNGIKRVVLTSTDKAVYPINAYGMSKGMAEKLTLRNPNNCVCRYGNVLASRGSVVRGFLEQLDNNVPLRITDYSMTRFWITLDFAAEFVTGVGLKNETGGVFYPDMKSSKLTHLAEAVCEAYGLDLPKTEHIGIRPGEKIHESISETVSSANCHYYTSDELVALVKPIVDQWKQK